MSRNAHGLTYRQERFCRAFIEQGEAACAARDAGYARASAGNQGYRLLSNARVRARIAAIQADMARDDARRADALLAKLEVLYRKAAWIGDYAAAARIVASQARLAGLMGGTAGQEDGENACDDGAAGRSSAAPGVKEEALAEVPGAGNDDKRRKMTMNDETFSGNPGVCPFESRG